MNYAKQIKKKRILVLHTARNRHFFSTACQRIVCISMWNQHKYKTTQPVVTRNPQIVNCRMRSFLFLYFRVFLMPRLSCSTHIFICTQKKYTKTQYTASCILLDIIWKYSSRWISNGIEWKSKQLLRNKITFFLSLSFQFCFYFFVVIWIGLLIDRQFKFL